MKTVKENAVADETSVESASIETAKLPQRHDILTRLNTALQWLEGKYTTKKLIHPARVAMFRACVYGYSVYLQALKDEELEIRIAELEKKLDGSVVIPDGRKQSKT